MPNALVTVEFKGVVDGQVYPRDIKPGETITGDLAAVAIKEGWGEDLDKPAASAPQAPNAPVEEPQEPPAVGGDGSSDLNSVPWLKLRSMALKISPDFKGKKDDAIRLIEEHRAGTPAPVSP